MLSDSRIHSPFTGRKGRLGRSPATKNPRLTVDGREGVKAFEDQLRNLSLRWQLVDVEGSTIQPILLSDPLNEL